jgi:hypothetical protein
LLKAILRRGRGLPDHHLAHPEREWLLGLLVAMLFLLGGIAWAAQLYFSHADAKPVSTELNNTGQQIYRDSDVARSLETLKERGEKNNLSRQALERTPRTPSFIPIEQGEVATTTPTENTSGEDTGPVPAPAEVPPEVTPVIPAQR